MQTPEVSVIIPNYNHASYLPKRIESVLNQTFQDFEVIILDDCSTDNSREIIASYAALDDRIKFYFNDLNSGSTFKQWNKGVSKSSGKYLWFAESDDYCAPEFLELTITILNENENVGLVYSESYVVNDNNNILKIYSVDLAKEKKRNWNSDFVNNGKKEVTDYLLQRNTIPNASAVVFRKILYEKVGRANENMNYCGDWMLYVKILCESDIYFISQPLNYFRTHAFTQRQKKVFSFVAIKENLMIIEYVKNKLTIDVPPKFIYKSVVSRWLNCLRKNSLKRGDLKQHYLFYNRFKKEGVNINSLIFNFFFLNFRIKVRKLISMKK